MSTQVLDEQQADDEVGEPAAIGRRRVLGVLGGALALAACSEIPTIPGLDPVVPPGMPPAPPGAPPPPTTPLPPPPVASGPLPTVLVNDPVRHLLSRATYGFDAEDYAAAQQLGIEGWLAAQLAPEGIDDGALANYLQRYPALSLTSGQIRDRDEDNGGGTRADRHLVEAAVVRQIFSQRKLYEVMAEFWANHFNVRTPSDDNRGRRTVEDREVLRANALGTFAELLSALVKSPAMLNYLNQERSRGNGDNTPNEDFARELMELHTVGRNNGYTEDDVKAAAQLLTGLTYDYGDDVFTYDGGRHYVGPVTIMGVTYPNASAGAGLDEIETFVGNLARDPRTAAYLASKLAQRFVSDVAPQTLVDSLAQVYLANDTAIPPVLTALFTSPEFASSVGQKTRRPREDIAAAINALGFELRTNPEDADQLLGIARALGDQPYFWPTPDGLPDTREHWVSAGNLLTRWNFHWDLTHGGYDAILSSADDVFSAFLADTAPATAGALVDALAQRLVFQPLAAEHRAAVLSYLDKAEGDALDDADAEAKAAAAVILNAPHHIQR